MANLNEDVSNAMSKSDQKEKSAEEEMEQDEAQENLITKEEERLQRFAILREVLEPFIGKKASEYFELL